HCPSTGARRVVDRLFDVGAAREEVVCELGETRVDVGASDLFDTAANRRVELRALGRAEVVVQGLADQSMRKAVAARTSSTGEDPRGRRATEELDELVRRPARHPLAQRDV